MTEFRTLPWTRTPDDAPRRVGVEMEMAGVEAPDIAQAVIDELGGSFDADSAFSGTVRDTELGEFTVELDAEILTSRRYLDALKQLGIELEGGAFRDNLEKLLSQVTGLVVPHELVCPPVPLAALPRIDAIRARLHAAGARGTEASALYAFGLQFNIEIHSQDADHLLAILQAFLLRYPTILERDEIDLSRKLTPYVQPFPEDFVAHLLDPDYAPDRDGLIDDYLRYTPTRNRPLDALPLFAWLDPDRVDAAPVEHALVKPRPAWHYRLPDCRIDDPDWSLAEPWAAWAGVEDLAHRPDDLRREARRRFGESSALKRWWSATWRSLTRRGQR
ncbi:amidoligase enzyme [Wenzhouxiangella sp. XN79A]|uniref:amidoligase family protein n=1 Tax=Wenzhouxiangella sp. XN79A TaxID=2724193 RepID=UPI00144AC25A|nr:amidoligase enzyme [Wenzhouxiangella sp. XN79A]